LELQRCADDNALNNPLVLLLLDAHHLKGVTIDGGQMYYEIY